jgi:hypothetical protein
MIGVSKCAKLVFTILVYRHSPEEFSKLRERRFKSMYTKTHGAGRHRDEFDASHPAIHRYNDIAGFAELYWDGGTRILAELFLQGDRRRKYGKAVAAGRRPETVSPDRFYPLYALYVEASGISHPQRSSEADRRLALQESLQFVREEATKLGCYVDLKHEEVILDATDVQRLFS